MPDFSTNEPGVTGAAATGSDGRPRALVTRPEDDAADIAEALRARDIDPVLAPLMTVVHLNRDIAADIESAQAILFTSRNGVRAFCALTPRRDRPVYAVGDSTASLAREAGFTTVESAAGNSTDLARLVAGSLQPENGPLFHAAGETVAGELSEFLAGKGFTTNRKALYQAVPVANLPDDAARALADDALEFVLLFSPRTARVFHRLVEAAGLAGACGRLTALCLSDAVAAALPPDIWGKVRIAAEPTSRALLETIEAIDPGDQAGPVVGSSTVPATGPRDEISEGVEWKPESEENGQQDPLEAVRKDAPHPSPERPEEKSAMTKPTPPEQTAAAAAAAATAAAASVPSDRSGAKSRVSPLAALFGVMLIALVAAIATLPAWRHVLPPALQAHLGGGAADTAREMEAARQATSALASALAESQAATRSLTATVAAFETRLAELERRQADSALALDALRKTPAAGPAADPAQSAKLTELARALAEAAKRDAAGEKQRAENSAKMTALVAAMEGRIAGLESRLQAARQAATASGKTDSLALAAGQLRDALSRAGAFEAELATLRRLGGDSPRVATVLEPVAGYAAAGVPTRTALLARLPAVVESALAASRSPDQAGLIDRTVARLRGFVTVRRIDGKGGGVEAVLARAEIAADKDDLATVVAELGALDGGAAEAAAPWLSSARARLALDDAARALNRIVLNGLAGGG